MGSSSDKLETGFVRNSLVSANLVQSSVEGSFQSTSTQWVTYISINSMLTIIQVSSNNKIMI